MSEKNEKENKTTQTADSPALEYKNKGGRPPRSHYEQPIQEIINVSAPVAALILQQHLERRKGYKELKKSLQDVCFYVIDHAIGKARQKIEHSGGIITYADLAKGADDLDKKPRPILAEVEEIANKVTEQTTPRPETDP